MAPMQASMSWFLYESRLSDDDAGGFGLDVQLAPTTPINVDSIVGHDGSQSPVDVANSSQSDYIVLTEISTHAQSLAESDMQIVDNAVASPLHATAHQRRQSYEQNHHWQDSWAAKLPWVESVLGRNGFVT